MLLAEGSTLALSSSLKTAEQWMQACSQGKVRSDDTQNANAYLSRVFPRLKLRVNMHEALAALEQPDSKSMQTANMYLKRYASVHPVCESLLVLCEQKRQNNLKSQN